MSKKKHHNALEQARRNRLRAIELELSALVAGPSKTSKLQTLKLTNKLIRSRVCPGQPIDESLPGSPKATSSGNQGPVSHADSERLSRARFAAELKKLRGLLKQYYPWQIGIENSKRAVLVAAIQCVKGIQNSPSTLPNATQASPETSCSSSELDDSLFDDGESVEPVSQEDGGCPIASKASPETSCSSSELDDSLFDDGESVEAVSQEYGGCPIAPQASPETSCSSSELDDSLFDDGESVEAVSQEYGGCPIAPQASPETSCSSSELDDSLSDDGRKH